MTSVDETTGHPGQDEPTVPGSRVLWYFLAILSAATAVIHFAVAGEHFQEYWLFGVFMLVTAWLQLTWAAAAVVRPSRPLLWCGVVLNIGIVAVYIVTRTVGDVVGPAPHDVEPFGFGDGLCTVLEAIVVAGCITLLLARTDRRVRRDILVMASGGTGAAIATLLSVALVAGGPDMVMSASDSSSSSSGSSSSSAAMPGMQRPGPASSSLKLATASPAGDITMPDPNMQMEPGMKMASSAPCTSLPTTRQQQAAVTMVNTSWQDARKYQSLAVAKAAGYRPITPTGDPVVHYLNPAYYQDTLRGGPVLNYTDPQSLVYANTPSGAVLVAAMYITGPGGATPQPGGCLTQWHVHTNLCLTRGLNVVGSVSPARPTCPAGSRNKVTPPMLHVWFVPIPGGPTAVDAPNPQVVRAAEQVKSPANGQA